VLEDALMRVELIVLPPAEPGQPPPAKE